MPITATTSEFVDATAPQADWRSCRFLTCSVLPVRVACNAHCPFCFSKSSISALRHDDADWERLDVERYYTFARRLGANRLVVTGGGEPLLKPDTVVSLVRRGRVFFDEIALFTNGTFLTTELSRRLSKAGLSYICYSRHHHDDDACRALMGRTVPTLSRFVEAAGDLPIRATCVMTRGAIDSGAAAKRYMTALEPYGITQYTFKHTYVAYEHSLFADSSANNWSRRHEVADDPFADRGRVLAQLPWGPRIRRIGSLQVCYYFEPTPRWELENQLCRSTNLLSDGTIYASLEDQRSRLFQLTAS